MKEFFLEFFDEHRDDIKDWMGWILLIIGLAVIGGLYKLLF